MIWSGINYIMEIFNKNFLLSPNPCRRVLNSTRSSVCNSIKIEMVLNNAFRFIIRPAYRIEDII